MSPIQTVNQFFQAIIEKKTADIQAFYVQDEQTYVILEGPRLATLGFSKIQKGWFDFCDSPISLDTIDWLEGPFAESEGDMAWVAGVLKLSVTVKEKTFHQTFRASFVLKKQANAPQNPEYTEGWLIRHEHISGALTDPYGMGDWLKTTNNEM